MNVVRKPLLKLNERKAAGLDNIPIELLKMAGNIVAPSLTQTFTKSISTGIFLAEWKRQGVTLVFITEGKRGDPNNCLPISIIPTVAKMFEKITYDQIYEYFIVGALNFVMLCFCSCLSDNQVSKNFVLCDLGSTGIHALVIIYLRMFFYKTIELSVQILVPDL